MTVNLITSLDDASFGRSKLGSIWGKIYFQIGSDQFFPENGWTDMVAAFARAWLQGVLQIANGRVGKDRVPFFDGPLAVDISVQSHGFVHLEFIDNEAVKLATTSELQDLLENALAVASLVLQRCRERGWLNLDTEALTALTADAPKRLSS
jgi:hypothetical protein